MKEHGLGDAPVDIAYRDKLNAVAMALDHTFNGDAKGADRKVGFVILLFELGNNPGRCNFISNSDRKDVVTLMKEMIARFEGQPEMTGHA